MKMYKLFVIENLSIKLHFGNVDVTCLSCSSQPHSVNRLLFVNYTLDVFSPSGLYLNLGFVLGKFVIISNKLSPSMVIYGTELSH